MTPRARIHPRMASSSRWAHWDAAVGQGRSPADVLAALPDASIVEMLRAADRQGRDYERDLLAVELGNRLVRLRRELRLLRHDRP